MIPGDENVCVSVDGRREYQTIIGIAKIVKPRMPRLLHNRLLAKQRLH